jgi:tetratricopeptide (TPR) repeat protein
MKRHRLAHACACLVLGLALPAPARAQAPATPAPETPPEVAPNAQQTAEALFAEGSTLFEQWQFVHAEQKYREALTHWEHPVIYLYLSRALEKQGHLERAYETLQQALGRNPELLSPEDAQVAEELRTGLESRLAQIEVHCADAGAGVLLDGMPWFTAPGPQRKMLRPGQHVIIARKAGYFPVTEVVTLIPGKQTRVEVRLSVDEIRVERRWRPRTPWMVVGGGAVTSVLGGLLLRQAMNDYAAFGKALTACEGQLSCDRVSIRRRDSGKWKDAVGTGVLIAGSAAVVVGLAGVLLNQPHSSRSEPTDGVQFDFAPMVSGDGAGVSAEIRF